MAVGFSIRHRALVIKDVVRRIREFMKITGTKIDTIAFRGMSGALIAPTVADRLKIPMVMIRKGENTHGKHVEGKTKEINNYIIIDDFVATGATIESIISAVEDKTSGKHKLVKIFCWQYCWKRCYFKCDDECSEIEIDCMDEKLHDRLADLVKK